MCGRGESLPAVRDISLRAAAQQTSNESIMTELSELAVYINGYQTGKFPSTISLAFIGFFSESDTQYELQTNVENSNPNVEIQEVIILPKGIYPCSLSPSNLYLFS